ncbi:MAG: undecaprenyl-phosphate glucose phosphotransferase [Asticcacaulis sp.]
MTDALQRDVGTHEPTPADQTDPALRAQGLSLSPGLSSPPTSAHKRGPFRPERLVSLRERRAHEAHAFVFRLSDLAFLTLLPVILLHSLSATGWLSVSLADALPVAAAALVTAMALKSFDLYRFGRHEGLPGHLLRVILAVATGSVSALGLGVLTGLQQPIYTIGLWAALTVSGLMVLHGLCAAMVTRWRRKGLMTPNIVIVGATRHARKLIEAALERRDVNILGIFDDRLSRNPEDIADVPVLGDTKALLTHKITPYVDQIVVAVDPAARARVQNLIERLRYLPNEVSLLVDVDSESGREAALSRLSDMPLARVSGVSDDARKAFHKRLQDMIIGGVALVIFAPVMLLTAAAIRLDSPGPVFFRQRRHGFNNEAIRVWKFRSMRVESTDHTSARQISRDDDRVTRVGRFIRKTSLDELPQLFNVLRGEMSLVGPRPHAIGMKTAGTESDQLVSEYAWRHRIKPGMTGWAAIKGSRGALETADDVRRRVQLDIDYIERQSFWLDLYIMAMTIPCILGDRQAVR